MTAPSFSPSSGMSMLGRFFRFAAGFFSDTGADAGVKSSGRSSKSSSSSRRRLSP